MRLVQIENWALDVINSVDAGHPSEDARVELKAEWIEAQKAARQIAGHANAARGDPILWLVSYMRRVPRHHYDQDKHRVGYSLK